MKSFVKFCYCRISKASLSKSENVAALLVLVIVINEVTMSRDYAT